MSTDSSHIFDAALGLSADDRASLAYRLLQSLKPPGVRSDSDAKFENRTRNAESQTTRWAGHLLPTGTTWRATRYVKHFSGERSHVRPRVLAEAEAELLSAMLYYEDRQPGYWEHRDH